MLSRREMPLPFIETYEPMLLQLQVAAIDAFSISRRCDAEQNGPDAPSEETTQSSDTEPALEEVARKERNYVRQELREELEREPTEEEVDEWLRRHTEGY